MGISCTFLTISSNFYINYLSHIINSGVIFNKKTMFKKKSAHLVMIIVWGLTFLSCNKKDTETSSVVVPLITIRDASELRTTTTATMHFNIALNKTTTIPVSVDYLLVDGSATAPKDYTSGSGTIIIPATQASAPLDVS